MDPKEIWNAMDTAFTSTVNASQGLGNYDILTGEYLAKETLVRPLGHTWRNQRISPYNNDMKVFWIICWRKTPATMKDVQNHINGK